MRILHTTDFHFRLPWYEWLARNAPAYDACCLTGDLLDMFPNAETGLSQQARWVRDWLRAFPGRLFACTGNHDWWLEEIGGADTDAEGGWLRKAGRPGVTVDGTCESLGGYRFICHLLSLSINCDVLRLLRHHT